MASQKRPTRSWFRLPSFSRPTRAATTASGPPRAQALPVAQPRPSITRPTLTQSSSNTPTQPAQPPLAQPTQAPTPLPVAASPPVPASKSPPPQAATAPPATALPRNPTTPPPRATAPPPAPAQKSPPQRAAATPQSLVRAAPPKSPTSTTFPNAISLEPRVILIREGLKSTVPPPPAPKPASRPLAPASQAVTVIGANSEPILKPVAKPDPSLSPKTKHPTSPQSALTLPPHLLKSHVEHPEEKPKIVLVQETTEKPKVMPSNGQTHSTDISRLNEKPDVRKDNGNYKKLSDSEEFGRMVITVSGENKGAIMEWTPSLTKNSPLSPHKNGGNPRTGSVGEKYRIDSGSSNEEGRGKSKYKSCKAMTISSPPMSPFVNSNVQGVNNSILYNCSYRHHDPGVHFSFYRHGNGIKPNNEDRASGIW